ncbi:MAG: M48 family metallopeptidase [Wenzhouxiangella sp.]
MPYTIKTHPRARHVRLRVDPVEGVVVTVPKRFDQRQLPALMAERREWIEAVQARHARLRAARDADTLGLRPTRIDLPAVDEQWTVDYQHEPRLRLGFAVDAARSQLCLRLPEAPEAELDARIGERLRRWLLDHAHARLEPWLRSLAQAHGLRFSRLSVRNQRRRWGSCSANGAISLNARLLLASPAACRYVLIHELAHTVHLDHSPAFWALVARLDPDHRAHEAALKQVGPQLPDWLQAC